MHSQICRLSTLKDRISQFMGVDFDVLGEQILLQSLQSNAKYYHLSIAAFIEHLLTSKQALENLTQQLLISETWFMRDIEPVITGLNYLRTFKDSIRVLSAPAATGEEAISTLYLAELEGFLVNNISIDAIDLSHSAITKGKQGLYSATSFRSDCSKFKMDYFDQVSKYYKIKSCYHSRINFNCKNLISHDPASASYDLIICRNLFIYLNSMARSDVLNYFYNALSPEGIIVTTAAEASFFNANNWQKLHGHTSVFIQNQPLQAAHDNPAIGYSVHIKEYLNCLSQIRSDQKFCDVNNDKILLRENDLFEIKELPDYEELLQAHEQSPADQNIILLLGLVSSSAGNDAGALFWLNKIENCSRLSEEAHIIKNVIEGKL